MKWSYLVSLSFIFILVSFWKRNDFASEMPIIDELNQAPSQIKIDQPAFLTQVNNIDYEIQPLYDYELYGLVVSYELHDGNYNLHKRWNDHLNVADYCIVWDENASTKFLPKFEFWNGQFTCNFSTKDKQAWESFDSSKLSNNHLVTDKNYIRKKLRKISIGDQIRIEGWLSTYKNLNTGGVRSTSTSRDDTGNGACETIYVNDVTILKSYISLWRYLMYISLFTFLASLIMYFKAPYRAKNA
ncbi:MAG: hypothetical protein AAF304_03095 [Pseudomonadota bacterium]